MSQYYHPSSGRVNPEPFLAKSNDYGSNQYTSSTRGNPNDSGFTDLQNQLIPYYGVPQQGFPQDAYAQYPQDLSHLIDAYDKKPNSVTREIVLTHIDRSAQWPINIALPLTHSEDMTFAWEQRRYNDHNLDRNPEESIPRMLTKTSRRFEASMNRHGITFEMTNDFFKTPAGRSDYACHLVQIGNAALNTIELGAVVALYYTPPTGDPYEAFRMSQIDSLSELSAKFSGELTQWACVQKRPQSLAMQIEQAQQRLIQSTGSAGDLTILVQGMKSYVNDDPAQKIFALTGHKSDEKRDLVRGMVGQGTIVYTRDYHQEATEVMIDPSIHDRSIGNSWFMDDTGLIGCEPKNFETRKMDRVIYDEDADNEINFGFQQNFYASGLFQYPFEDMDESDNWFNRGSGLPSISNGGPYQGPSGNDLDFKGSSGRGILANTWKSTMFDNDRFPFLTDTIGARFFEGCHTWGAYFKTFRTKQNVIDYHIKCFLERDINTHQDFLFMAGETVRQFRSQNASLNNTQTWEQAMAVLDIDDTPPAKQNVVNPLQELEACKLLESISVSCTGLTKDNYRLMRSGLKQAESWLSQQLQDKNTFARTNDANTLLLDTLSKHRSQPSTFEALNSCWMQVQFLIITGYSSKPAQNGISVFVDGQTTSILCSETLQAGHDNVAFQVANETCGSWAGDRHIIQKWADFKSLDDDLKTDFYGMKAPAGVNVSETDKAHYRKAFAAKQISAVIAMSRIDNAGELSFLATDQDYFTWVIKRLGLDKATNFNNAGVQGMENALNSPIQLFESQLWLAPLVNLAVKSIKNIQKEWKVGGNASVRNVIDTFKSSMKQLNQLSSQICAFNADYSTLTNSSGDVNRTRYQRLQNLSNADHDRLTQTAEGIIEAKIKEHKGSADANITNMLDRVFSMYHSQLIDIYKLLDVVSGIEGNLTDADGNSLSSDQVAGNYLDKILDILFVNFIRHPKGTNSYRFVSIYLRVLIENLQTKDLNEILDSDMFGNQQLKLGKWWKNQVIEDDKQVARLLDLAREFVQDPQANAPTAALQTQSSRRNLIPPNETIAMNLRQLQRVSQQRFEVYDLVFHEIVAIYWRESSMSPELSDTELISAIDTKIQSNQYTLSVSPREGLLALMAVVFGPNNNGEATLDLIEGYNAGLGLQDEDLVTISNYIEAMGFDALPIANAMIAQQQNVGNAPPVKKLRNKLTRSQYITILNQLPIAGNFPVFCFENDILLPIFLLCLRPHMRYSMGTGIHMHGHGKSGKTFWSHATMMINHDAGRMTHFYHFAMWFRAIVMNTDNIVRMNNIICKQYLGGHGSSVYNPLDKNTTDGYREGRTDADVFVVPERPDKALSPTALDITGEYSERLKMTPRQNNMTNYTMATTMQQIWNWTPDRRIEQLTNKYTPDESQSAMNTIVFQAYNRYWNEADKRFSNIVQEAGHWRDCIYRGSGAVRNCHEPYFKQTTISAQAVISA